MANNDIDTGVVLTDDEARSGVTGHNVRYVLAFGLAGIVAAYIALAIYFGYDGLSASISETLSRGPVAMLQDLYPGMLVFLLGALTAALLMGLWTRILGPTENATQWGMRTRVAMQIAIIGIVLVLLY